MAYYICGQKDRQGAKSCSSRRVGEKPAEDAILDTVANQILSPEYLERVIESTRAKASDTADLERQIKLAKRKVEDLNIAIQRTLKAIERTGSESAYERLQERERERA